MIVQKKVSRSVFLSLGLFILIVLSIEAAFSQTKTKLKNDGPYIIRDSGGLRMVEIESGVLINKKYNNKPFTVVTDDGKHRFKVKLHPVDKPENKYSANGYSTLVLSDPHGDFESLYSILLAQGVINKDYTWTFGKNHLMIIGDVFDRGDDVVPIYWLIYKLEEEAKLAGGQVHFLLGNHEEMVLRGDLRYLTPKYVAIADTLGIQYHELWNQDSELGAWLRKRNVVQTIDNNLFVHAGLSNKVIQDGWTIEALNDSTRVYLGKSKKERDHSEVGKFLYGSEGPLWYRGMVKSEEKYLPLTTEDVDAIRKKFEISRIYVGHTMLPEVSSFYDDIIFDVNVKNSLNRKEGRTRGILITKEGTFIVFDDPSRNILIP